MADRNEIFDKVCGLIADQLPVKKEQITMSSRMVEDLHADSANLMMLIMDLETEFDITVADDMVAGVKTVEDIVTYLEENT